MPQPNPPTIADESSGASLWMTVQSRPIKLLVGVVLSSTALYLSFRSLHISDILASFATADFGLISLALSSVMINIFSKAMRWRALLGRSEVSFVTLLRALLLGQILNIALPSRPGDVSRIYMIRSTTIAWPFVAGTIVTEKTIDLMCYLLCFFLTLIFLPPLPVWVITSVYSFVIVTAIIAALLVALPQSHRLLNSSYLSWLPLALSKRIAEALRAMNSSFTTAAQPSVVVQIIAWSGLIWITAILTNYLLLRALAIDAPAISVVLLLIVLQISVSLPSVPGNIGIFQYICVLVLGIFGVSQTAAVSYGILLHVVAFAPPILVGGLLFAIAQPKRAH